MFVERSVFVGPLFHIQEIRIRDADQLGSRAAYGGRQRLMEDRFVHQVLRLGENARRLCLEGFANQYLAALAASDPAKLPLSKRWRYIAATVECHH